MTTFKRIGLASAAIVALWIAVSAWNYYRIDGRVLRSSAERLIARSERIRDGARPAYQEEVLGQLPANPRNGPYFRFDDHMGSATVYAEPSLGDAAESSRIVFGFELADRLESPLEPETGQTKIRMTLDSLVVEHSADDHLASSTPLDIAKDEVGEILVRVRVRDGKHFRLAWSRETDPEKPWRNRIDIPVINDDRFHSYVINAANALKRGLKAGESIRRVFVLPSDVDGDRVEIKFIRFLSRNSRYLADARGASYETVGKELRRVMYMWPEQRLGFAVRVPEDDPGLRFGTAVLLPDRPVRFSVEVREGSRSETVFDRRVTSESRWEDESIDLEPWAGRDVEIVFEVQGAADNVALWSSPWLSSRPIKPLNVIIVLEDTLRADHLSVYGYERATSPFKERLMSRHGTIFENVVSQATKTRPSVPSMMTSLLPTATGVWHFSDALREEFLTVAEILRSQGFVTASFVQNGNAGPYAGLHQGFDSLLDAETIGGSTEALFGDRLEAWLAAHRDRNFFLYLHLTDPHGAYDPPAPYDTWYREVGQAETVRSISAVDPDWNHAPTVEGRKALYDGEILHNDTVLERFVRDLHDSGIYDQTVLLFTSDHGEYLGEEGRWEHKPPGLVPVTRVPLMLVYPHRFTANRVIEERVQLLDIVPTILELAEVDTSALLLQGDSLVGLIEGRDRSRWRARLLMSEEPMALDKTVPSRNEGLNAFGSLYYGDWQLIASRSFRSIRGLVPESLRMKAFNLTRDPTGQDELESFTLDLYTRMQFSRILNEVQSNNIAAWKKWTNEGHGEEVAFDPDVLDRLKALGYVE